VHDNVGTLKITTLTSYTVQAVLNEMELVFRSWVNMLSIIWTSLYVL